MESSHLETFVKTTSPGRTEAASVNGTIRVRLCCMLLYERSA